MTKKVLITGGVRGIGFAVATAFLKKGYDVSVCYSSDEDSAKKAREIGLNVYRADVSNEGEVKSLFKKVGDVDILVNNAGVSLIKQIQDTSLEDFEKVFGVNMRGAFLCTREAVQGMIGKKSGLIVNVSSVWGEVGGSCESVYSASKSALLGFTKALAKELGYSGIRVNSVSPGVVDTRMNGCFSEDEKKSIVEEIPLGRVAEADEIARAVVFLDENEYITGADVPINGGFSIA